MEDRFVRLNSTEGWNLTLQVSDKRLNKMMPLIELTYDMEYHIIIFRYIFLFSDVLFYT